MKNNRVSGIVLAAIMATTLAGCGSEEKKSDSPGSSNNTNAEITDGNQGGSSNIEQPASLHSSVASANYVAPASFSAAPRAAVPTDRSEPSFGPVFGNGIRVDSPAWDYKPAYPSRSACGPSEGATFEVGPGRAYSELRDVPWLSLLPCDSVHVFARPQPYKDVIFLAARGAANKWITIAGIPDTNGNLPVISGDGAVMPTNTGANIHSDGAGLIIIKTPDPSAQSRDNNYKPGFLHITGLKLTSARPSSGFTNVQGQAASWNEFGSGVYINGAENVAVTYCELSNNGVGIFANSTGGEQLQTRNLLVARNYVHGNGNEYSFSTHNAYTEAIGTVYELNYFGPLFPGAYGDNIKERSAGVVLRYNFIKGGANLISLRDPQSNVDNEEFALDTLGDLLVKSAFVYSNIMNTVGIPDSVIGHGDGPFKANRQVRRGSLFVYNNTVVSQADASSYWENNNQYHNMPTPLVNFWNDETITDNGVTGPIQTTLVARNNILFSEAETGGGTRAPIALFYWQGKADLAGNWTNDFVTYRDGAGPGYANTLPVGTVFDGTGLGGLTNSGFDPSASTLLAGGNVTAHSSFNGLLGAPLHPYAAARGLGVISAPVTEPFAVTP